MTVVRCAAQCDVLFIATSSFGEGDPPENFNMFVLHLQRAALDGSKPLEGLQHVVLGYGASCYETFQVRRGSAPARTRKTPVVDAATHCSACSEHPPPDGQVPR